MTLTRSGAHADDSTPVGVGPLQSIVRKPGQRIAVSPMMGTWPRPTGLGKVRPMRTRLLDMHVQARHVQAGDKVRLGNGKTVLVTRCYRTPSGAIRLHGSAPLPQDFRPHVSLLIHRFELVPGDDEAGA